MTERVEWEVVDEAAPRKDSRAHEQRAHGRQQATRDAMRMMLGRGWKWKIAGTAIVSLVTLAFFATLTGALVLLFAAGTVLTAAVRKLKHWLAGDRPAAGPTSPMKM